MLHFCLRFRLFFLVFASMKRKQTKNILKNVMFSIVYDGISVAIKNG